MTSKYANRLTSSEWYDTTPQVARVERYIDTRKRNSGKASFENDVALSGLQLLSLIEARSDDIREHLLNLVYGELLGKL